MQTPPSRTDIRPHKLAAAGSCGAAHATVRFGAIAPPDACRSVRIEVTIYVARPGHKAILIGDKGSKIKSIGAKARQDLASLLDRPVHLFLNVKERRGWDEEGARLRAARKCVDALIMNGLHCLDGFARGFGKHILRGGFGCDVTHCFACAVGKRAVT